MAVIAAGMTGFYIFRVYFYTFYGASRSPEAHPHESPLVMLGPLLALAGLALVAGVLGPWTNEFLAPVFGGESPHYHDALLETVAVVAGVGGILIAVVIYFTSSDRLEFAKEALAPLYDLLFHKYYVDEIYDILIVKPTKAIGVFLEEKVEKYGIDYAVDEVGRQVRQVSALASLWQSGKVRTYALNMMAGLVAVLMFVVFL
jgi:NADH-quinone oxidoreductase subunit L